MTHYVVADSLKYLIRQCGTNDNRPQPGTHWSFKDIEVDPRPDTIFLVCIIVVPTGVVIVGPLTGDITKPRINLWQLHCRQPIDHVDVPGNKLWASLVDAITLLQGFPRTANLIRLEPTLLHVPACLAPSIIFCERDTPLRAILHAASCLVASLVLFEILSLWADRLHPWCIKQGLLGCSLQTDISLILSFTSIRICLNGLHVTSSVRITQNQVYSSVCLLL